MRKISLLFWIFIIVTLVATGLGVYSVSGDWGSWTLTVVVLIISAITLYATVIQPPKIWVSKPDELGYTDLIFYIYDENDIRVPRDYLLQLHVLLGNTGGKKAIITKVQIVEFKGPSGESIDLPELSKTIRGLQYSTWTSWSDLDRSTDRHVIPPPFILAPNEILVLIFRGRRGIYWGDRWNLKKFREYHESLVICPTHAVVEVTYRWGSHIQTLSKEVKVAVKQHQEYVDQLRILTKNFTTIPDIQDKPIILE